MEYERTLAPGTELNGEFRIQGLLGSGGFANTYLAMDLTLGREVAIKEFFPAELAVRANSKSVSVKSNAQSSQFEWARSRFVREAKTLAKFRHPSVVRVFRVFDANNTAYIVLEFVRGANMGAWLKRLQRLPTQDEFDILLPPLLDALEVVHHAGILHRDIKPANIYIREVDNMPVLLDFGAAKYATAGDNAGTTAAIVSKGYSPNEAYSTDTRLQGPWTDIYGLSATVFRALTGSAPPESTSRIMHDECVLTSDRAELQVLYRPQFLAAIDTALAIMPRDRPQSIGAWRKQLFPELDMVRPLVNPVGFGPASDAEWRPLSDAPTGTETIYSAPKSPSGARSGASAQLAAKVDSIVPANAAAAAFKPGQFTGEPAADFTKSIVSMVPSLRSANDGLSLVTRTVRRYVRPPEGASNTTFFAGVALLLIGAATLGMTAFQGDGNPVIGGTQDRLNVEKIALLEAVERKKISDEKRFAAEAAARERAEDEKRLAAEAAARKRAEDEKRFAAEAAARERAEDEKRFAAEAAARKRAEDEKRLAAESAARKRAEDEKRFAAEAAARRRAEDEKRFAAEAAARRRAEDEKRLAAERRRETEAAERRRLAEAKRDAEQEALTRLAESSQSPQESAGGPVCNGLYSAQIIERCERAQPDRLCACAADLELGERRYQRQAALASTTESVQVPAVLPLAPPSSQTLPSEAARRVYLTEIQSRLKERECYDGSVNGRIEDTQPALEKFVSSASPNGRRIELASATTREYEDWIGWFRSLERQFCVPSAPAKPDVANTPEIEPKQYRQSTPTRRVRPKTLRKPSHQAARYRDRSPRKPAGLPVSRNPPRRVQPTTTCCAAADSLNACAPLPATNASPCIIKFQG